MYSAYVLMLSFGDSNPNFCKYHDTNQLSLLPLQAERLRADLPGRQDHRRAHPRVQAEGQEVPRIRLPGSLKGGKTPREEEPHSYPKCKKGNKYNSNHLLGRNSFKKVIFPIFPFPNCTIMVVQLNFSPEMKIVSML